MAAKLGSQNAYRKIILIGLVIALVAALSLFFGLHEDSRFHKLTRFERLANTIFYSVEKTPAMVWQYKEGEIFTLAMPYYIQEHALTCEVSALRTVLSYHGIHTSEDELISKLKFDTREQISPDGTWGDPEEGFVGSVDGSVFDRTGFGVYDKPIAELARIYLNAEVVENADLNKILNEVTSGNPVIAWGLLSKRNTISWETEEGKTITVQPGEHARVVIGFTGPIDNPTKIVMLDPIYGLIYMNTAKFLSDWQIMNNRAVVVRK